MDEWGSDRDDASTRSTRHSDRDDSSTDSQSSQENTSTEMLEDEGRHQVPLPREHSYLSGSSHPLLGEASLDDDPSIIHSTDELAILELPAIVLFPGSTIPVKLRDRGWIEYLGRQIETCRSLPHLQPKVQLGIVTYETIPARQRRRSRGRRQQQQQQARETGHGGYTSDTDEPDSDEEDYELGEYNYDIPTNNSNILPQDRKYIGRIGTIATIQYTHERSNPDDVTNSIQSPWQRYHTLRELVFTAVGTGRFQILGPSDGHSDHPRVYRIRKLVDSFPAKPPLIVNRQFFSSFPSTRIKLPKPQTEDPDEDDEDEDDPWAWREQRHQQWAWNLAQITHTPYIVYKKCWPWKRLDQLVALLENNDGIAANLPSLGNTSIEVKGSPTQFSFWLASNLPFTEEERLQLLHMNSTIRRLERIHSKLQDLVQASQTRFLSCAMCRTSLAKVQDVFQVEGAEAVTSNYGKFMNLCTISSKQVPAQLMASPVNDHGYIHQITTIRHVLDERALFLQGPPCTQNSYFPGFSWTITYCRGCASLLGWKFLRVDDSEEAQNPNCPNAFFGFQSSSLETL